MLSQLDPSLRGPLKTMVAQARTLEYLAALSQSVSEPTRQPGLNNDMKLAHRLHDYLTQLEGDIQKTIRLCAWPFAKTEFKQPMTDSTLSQD